MNCTVVTALADRKKFSVDRNLCFNCGRSNHRPDQCRRRGCVKWKYRHHTSICGRQERRNNSSLNGVSLTVLPAIIPVSIEGQVLLVYLDTGSGRNFISRDAVKMLKLKPKGHDTREILTVNGTSPNFDAHIKSLDGKSCEEFEFTGSKLADFTICEKARYEPDEMGVPT